MSLSFTLCKMKTIRPFQPASDLGLAFDDVFKACCELKRKNNGWEAGYRTNGLNLAPVFSPPTEGKEHPLVEKGRRAELEESLEERWALFLCLWLSAPRSCACLS